MAHRDIDFYLAPGQKQNFPVPEFTEFLFVKAAPRSFNVIINGQTTNMDAGEKTRLKEKVTSLSLHNTDDLRPIAGVVVVGDGDYEKIIISGEVNAETLLKKADGTNAPDSRHQQSVTLNLTDTTVRTYTRGTIYKTGYYNSTDCLFTIRGRLFATNTLDPLVVHELNPLTLGEIATFTPDMPTAPTTPTRYVEVVEDTQTGAIYANMNNGYCYALTLSDSGFSFGSRITMGGAFVNGRGIAVNSSGREFAVADDKYQDVLRIYDLDSGDLKNTFTFDQFGGASNWFQVLYIDGYLAKNSGGQGGTTVWDVSSNTPVQVSHWLDDNAERFPKWCYDQDLKLFWTGNSARVRSWWTETWSTYGKGFARVSNGYRLTKLAPVDIQTPLTFTLDGDGKQLVSGKIIALVLELINKSFPPPLYYLDSVYGYEAENLTLKSGNRSFLTVGFADNFTVSTSEQITLTIDKDLQF